ncbi:ATP-dependent DNA ligase [Kineococcus xinjiangensis]|uniref:DNA ligase (ATP) n=1 Tax=Kineococcus xinjiangensis TaxID=512762 RepID=A0A2S6ITN1_9ACTN|nr:ATP-dependent DNA ligase [Kineococcus xinjiangensis]
MQPPVTPMLARAAKALPEQPAEAPGWSYEPKWDGFRCLVFRDGDEVVLGSRGSKPLTRYFPEVVAAALAELPPRVVVDGELFVPAADGRRLDWDALSQRIHPAASRIAMLSEQTPARFVAFDLLACGEEDLTAAPFAQRRARLVGALAGAGATFSVTSATTDRDRAIEWFTRFEGAGLDGVVAKPLAGPYSPGERTMTKVKHSRTAECVVMGYRPHKSIDDGIGSMLLGLHDDGELHMVGGASAFTTARRRELLEQFQELRVGADVTTAGEPNRWQRREDDSWVPLRPELVAEVRYDQMEGQRFRHAVQFLRWRPDKEPAQCTRDQLDAPADYDLADVLSGAAPRGAGTGQEG